MNESQAKNPISKARLEVLVDGIFAIAMTILVLEIKPPEINDVHSVPGLLQALGHNAAIFGSYLLSFLMLGMFWYRHNQLFGELQVVTATVLGFQLLQLATAAFFPFCAALLGRYPTNGLSIVIYVACVFIYNLASLGVWHGAYGLASHKVAVSTSNLRLRRRIIRACIILFGLLCLTIAIAFVR
jgi:uncharacterized membrane protein